MSAPIRTLEAEYLRSLARYHWVSIRTIGSLGIFGARLLALRCARCLPFPLVDSETACSESPLAALCSVESAFGISPVDLAEKDQIEQSLAHQCCSVPKSRMTAAIAYSSDEEVGCVNHKARCKYLCR